ncbi:MAG: hypothetical protein GXO03_00430 [Aquificae bacterium]|nr:hypothetical protein [Aquificota bacterium]
MGVKSELKEFVLNFGRSLGEKEAFEGELLKFRLALKARVVRVLSFSPDEAVKEQLMAQLLEGLEEALKELEESLGRGEPEQLRRQALFLEGINGTLKDFLADDGIGDRHALSRLAAYLSELVERINLELREQKGGLLRRLRGFLFGA